MKQLKKRLTLNKQAVSNLNQSGMGIILGGGPTVNNSLVVAGRGGCVMEPTVRLCTNFGSPCEQPTQAVTCAATCIVTCDDGTCLGTCVNSCNGTCHCTNGCPVTDAGRC